MSFAGKALDTMRFLRQIAASKVALTLFSVHSALALYSVISKAPTDDRQELIDCRTIAVAGRAIQIPTEPAMVKLLGWLDLPSIAVYYVFWRALYLVIDVFHLPIDVYAMSWANAAILLVITSVQWWTTGFAVQSSIQWVRGSKAAAP